MNFEQASKIFGQLKKYRETNDENVMKSYPINHLRMALGVFHADKGWAHYEDLEHYIQQREEEEKKAKEKQSLSWWEKPIFINLIRPICELIIGGIIGWGIAVASQGGELDKLRVIIADKNSSISQKESKIVELEKENVALTTKTPEMPVTVIDKETGNLLHIGKPLPHDTYYEFPVTLIDGKFSGRIDQYRFIDENTIGLVVIKKDITEKK